MNKRLSIDRFSNIIRNECYKRRNQFIHSFFTKPVQLKLKQPIVSFTFDDFPASAYQNGGAILQKYGKFGTYYVSMGLQNHQSELGLLFSERDLNNLISEGHEIGCHTYNHININQTPYHQIKNDILRNNEEIKNRFPNITIKSFAYPFGEYNLSTKKFLRNCFTCCRSTKAGINSGLIDLNFLKANCLYGSCADSQKIGCLIENNLREIGWLIFYTHDIRNNPSPYGCTDKHLSKTVDLVLKSGAQILTIGQALKIILAL